MIKIFSGQGAKYIPAHNNNINKKNNFKIITGTGS